MKRACVFALVVGTFIAGAGGAGANGSGSSDTCWVEGMI